MILLPARRVRRRKERRGYPPLLIDIINFAALYQHQISAAENGENGGNDEADAEAEAADGEGTA